MPCERMGDMNVGGPLDGVRVVEVGHYAAGPACGAVLADWGAEVVKVEPPSGDAARGPGSTQAISRNPRYELHNRNKLGLAIDLKTPAGRAVMERLLERADVFVTNLRPGALDRLGLAWGTVTDRHQRLVYGLVTGYGLGTLDEDRASYDHGAFWSAAGAADLFASGGVPAQPTGGMGDRVAGTALAGGIASALYEREHTGRGRLVTVSLFGTGLWMLGSEASDALAEGRVYRRRERAFQRIPTLNCFRAGDGAWFWLLLMEPARHWRKLVRATGSSLLAAWEPIAKDARVLADRAPELIALLDEIFAARTLSEWAEIFGREDVWFSPVRTVEQAVRDASARVAGAIIPVVGCPGEEVVDTPVRFGSRPRAGSARAPDVGAHSRRVLESLGFAAEDVESLVESGVVVDGTSDIRIETD